MGCGEPWRAGRSSIARQMSVNTFRWPRWEALNADAYAVK